MYGHIGARSAAGEVDDEARSKAMARTAIVGGGGLTGGRLEDLCLAVYRR